MIQANELRIGNLFYDDDGLIVRMTGYKPLDHLFRCDSKEGCTLLFDKVGGTEGWEMENTECNPIPLTPEILQAVGFKQGDNTNVNAHFFTTTLVMPGEISIDINPENGICFLVDRDENIKLKPVKYLHTLQNLLFALTGQELIYKP